MVFPLFSPVVCMPVVDPDTREGWVWEKGQGGFHPQVQVVVRYSWTVALHIPAAGNQAEAGATMGCWGWTYARKNNH